MICTIHQNTEGIGLTANKTAITQQCLLFLLLCPQVGKRVDDDAEHQVEDNDDDQEVEEKIVNKTESKLWFLKENKKTNRKTVSIMVIERYQYTLFGNEIDGA